VRSPEPSAAAEKALRPREVSAPAGGDAAFRGSGAGPSDTANLSGLVSPVPCAEAAASFASLDHAVHARSARTIEDLVQDMLRPMLQSWLDAHLPALVERLVRQEVERISGRS
jgi:cell pole-organizing protein PopZ